MTGQLPSNVHDNGQQQSPVISFLWGDFPILQENYAEVSKEKTNRIGSRKYKCILYTCMFLYLPFCWTLFRLRCTMHRVEGPVDLLCSAYFS